MPALRTTLRPVSGLIPCLLLWLSVQPGAGAAVPVTTRTVGELAVYPESSAPATVISLNDSELSAQVTAPVVAVSVKVGDRVEAGHTLVELDATDFELALKRAEATLASLRARHDLARNQLKRVRTLARSKSASAELLNQREAEVSALSADITAQKIAIQMARRDLDHSRISAPFDALVLERHAQIGELATPGKTLMRLLEAANLEVEARVQPNDVDAVQQAAALEFDSQGRRYPVTIRSVVSALDERERSRKLRLTFKSEQALPYSAGLLVWRQNTPHLPPHLLVQRLERLGILTAVDDQAVFVPIEGATEGRPAAVSLPRNTAVIVDGRFRVQPGDTLILDE